MRQLLWTVPIFSKKSSSVKFLFIKVSERLSEQILKGYFCYELKQRQCLFAKENAPHQTRRILKTWIRVEKNWLNGTKGHGFTRIFSGMK